MMKKDENIANTSIELPPDNHKHTSAMYSYENIDNHRMVELLPQYKSLTASKTTQNEKNKIEHASEEVVSSLVIEKFTDALEKIRSRSLQRKLKQSQKFDFERSQSQSSEKLSDTVNNSFLKNFKNLFLDIPNERASNTIQDEETESSPLLSSSNYDETTEDNQDCKQFIYFLKDPLIDSYTNLDDAEKMTKATENLNFHHSNVFGWTSQNDLSYNTEAVSFNVRLNKTDEKLEKLMSLTIINFEINSQATRALEFCKNSKHFIGTLQHVESERLLLLSILRDAALIKELKILRCESVIDSFDCSNSGTVLIKHLFFPGSNASYKEKRTTRWYVCTVSCGTEIFASAPRQANENGNVYFDDEFKLNLLSSLFEITVAIYALPLLNKKKRSSLSKFVPHQQDNRSHNCFPLYNAISSTGFELYGKTVVHINDLRKSRFNLFQLCKHSKLYGTFNANFEISLNFSEKLKCFLKLGRKIGHVTVWNRLWCCLEGKRIKCFTYPSHEEENKPLDVLELDRCVSGAARTEKPKTLLLKVLEEDIKEKLLPSIVILKFDTAYQLEEWERGINSVFNTLTNWNCLKC